MSFFIFFGFFSFFYMTVCSSIGTLFPFELCPCPASNRSFILTIPIFIMLCVSSPYILNMLGIYPEVIETDYFNKQGQYRMDSTVSPRMMNSIMYKMCYYDFDKVYTHYGRAPGFDLVRNSEIGGRNIQFTHLEEAFTSEHWMVRIYRVKKDETHPNFEEKLRRK